MAQGNQCHGRRSRPTQWPAQGSGLWHIPCHGRCRSGSAAALTAVALGSRHPCVQNSIKQNSPVGTYALRFEDKWDRRTVFSVKLFFCGRGLCISYVKRVSTVCQSVISEYREDTRLRLAARARLAVHWSPPDPARARAPRPVARRAPRGAGRRASGRAAAARAGSVRRDSRGLAAVAAPAAVRTRRPARAPRPRGAPTASTEAREPRAAGRTPTRRSADDAQARHRGTSPATHRGVV